MLCERNRKQRASVRFHCCRLLYSDDSAYTGYRPRLYATLLELSGLGKASQSQGPMKGEEDRKERKERSKQGDLENEYNESKKEWTKIESDCENR